MGGGRGEERSSDGSSTDGASSVSTSRSPGDKDDVIVGVSHELPLPRTALGLRRPVS